MFVDSQVCFLSSPPHSKSGDWKIQSSKTGAADALPRIRVSESHVQTAKKIKMEGMQMQTLGCLM